VVVGSTPTRLTKHYQGVTPKRDSLFCFQNCLRILSRIFQGLKSENQPRGRDGQFKADNLQIAVLSHRRCRCPVMWWQGVDLPLAETELLADFFTRLVKIFF
jgi:hypothetical protein